MAVGLRTRKAQGGIGMRLAMRPRHPHDTGSGEHAGARDTATPRSPAGASRRSQAHPRPPRCYVPSPAASARQAEALSREGTK
jgi:hypothetical protein